MLTVSGIDISRWQNKIDFTKLSKTNVKFIFIKATQGIKTVDSSFKETWKNLQNLGILHSAYHFFQSNLDPIQQAEHFIKTVGVLGDRHLPLVADVERWETGDLQDSGKLQDSVESFLKKVEAESGKKPILYTGSAFSRSYLGTRFGGYPLWVAHYGPPKPKISSAWKDWTFWQYTDQGKVDGIQTNTDMNWFNGTEQELLALCGSPKPVVEVKPEVFHKTYIVISGDTLGKISKRYNVSIEDLVTLNHIEDQNKISVGQVLVLE